MWTLLWVPAVLAGLALAITGSQQTLRAARTLATKVGIPPFFIGMTIVAFGTDLPEIANSITASASGHGDLNVGDSIGSVVTQMTLVAGLLCLVAPLRTERKVIASGGIVTIVSLLVGAMLLADQSLSRYDGLILLAFWLVGTVAIHRVGDGPRIEQGRLFERGAFSLLRDLLIGMAAVAGGAVVVVFGFSALADWFGVPEYASSFLVLSIGTSLPELFIDGAALRSGDKELAIGDLLGSSFVDATVSLGIGPVLFPIVVSADATSGSLLAAAIIAGTVGFLLLRTDHTASSAPAFLALYAMAYVLIIL